MLSAYGQLASKVSKLPFFFILITKYIKKKGEIDVSRVNSVSCVNKIEEKET